MNTPAVSGPAAPVADTVPELPAEFEHAIYVSHPRNTDLRGLNHDQAWHHYVTYGRREGRPCSRVDSRSAFLGLLPGEGARLEVGPGAHPCLDPGAPGVHMLDVFPTEQLRETAQSQGDDPTAVPQIDFVWTGQPYRELTDERFDAVIASHSLEHQPCLITHLTDVASLLRLCGRLFLILRDRRYSSFRFLPDTTLADVLAAFTERRSRHTVRNVMTERLLRTHDDAGEHWEGRHGSDPRQRLPDASLCEQVTAVMRRMRAARNYIDVPAWHFTPESFRYLIEALATIGSSPFRIERIYPTLRASGEFYAVLHVAV